MFRLAEIFSDGLILQRRRPTRIWGVSDAADTLTVFLDGAPLLTAPVPAGDFSLTLPPVEAQKNAVLTFTGRDGSVVLRDVDFGEVWISSGQSNMEFILDWDADRAETVSSADDPHLRYYEVPKFCFPGERAENLKPDAVRWARWLSFTPEYAPGFSAVAAYFALRLRKEFPDVPIGIVDVSWGGTIAATWMAAEDLAADPELKRTYLDAYRDGLSRLSPDWEARDYRQRAASQTEKALLDAARLMRGEITFDAAQRARLRKMAATARTAPKTPHDANRPGALHEQMQQQIAGYTASGVIWYQGESDDEHADLYEHLFTALIRRWRADWEDEGLPFLFVQLAPFEEWHHVQAMNYPQLRRAQAEVARTVPRAWMASIMDAGMRYDIHPKKKKPAGERLALLALCHVYGLSEIHADAPELSGVTHREDTLTLRFSDGEGLYGTVDGSALTLLADGVSVPFTAEIRGSALVLAAPAIRDAARLQVLFAQENYCTVGLYNRFGLPAKPFIAGLDSLF